MLRGSVRDAPNDLRSRFDEHSAVSGTGNIPTLAGSTKYAFAETLGWRQGLNKKLRQARWFYALILISASAGVGRDFIGVNPVKALYWTAVINGLLAPFQS